MNAPRLTAAAVAHLGGRPLVLRASPRHGCCGGHAAVPIAEIGPPDDPDRYLVVAGPVTCFVERELVTSSGTARTDPGVWEVDSAGRGRWRRLLLLGAEGIDPAHTHR